MLRKSLLLSAFALLLCTHNGRADDDMTLSTPEALNKAHTWITAHPDRAEGYLFLAVIEGSAWVDGMDSQVPITRGEKETDPPIYTPLFLTLIATNPLDGTRINHLKASLAAYRRAVDLNPADPNAQVGLGWALEEADRMRLDDGPQTLTTDERYALQAAIAQLADPDFDQRQQGAATIATLMPRALPILVQINSPDVEVSTRVDATIHEYWRKQAAEHYMAAFTSSLQKDLNSNGPLPPECLISFIAATRLISLGEPPLKPEEFKKLQDAIIDILAKYESRC